MLKRYCSARMQNPIAANPFLTQLNILEFYIDTIFVMYIVMYINMQHSRVLKQPTAFDLFFSVAVVISFSFVRLGPENSWATILAYCHLYLPNEIDLFPSDRDAKCTHEGKTGTSSRSIHIRQGKVVVG